MSLQSIRLGRHKRLQAAAANNPLMKQGETGEAVETVQQALIDLGFKMPISTRNTGFPDGIYGKETMSTVTAFQASAGLQQDGIVGRDTLQCLDKLLFALQIRDHAQFQADVMLPPPMRKYNAS
jgi:peptidoglycan hydrolase-like protein with peptidoglycan-binding domain